MKKTIKTVLGLLILCGILSIQGCKQGLEAVKNTTGKYQSVGIVELSVDNTFSEWHEKVGLVAKSPVSPGNLEISTEEKQFLEDTVKEVSAEIVKNSKYKLINTLESGKTVVVGDKTYLGELGYKGELTQDQVKELCKKNNVEAIAIVQLQYFFFDKPYAMKSITEFSANLKVISKGGSELKANSGGLAATVILYDATGKRLHKAREMSWTNRVKPFFIQGHTFHLTNESKPVLEEAKKSIIGNIQAINRC